VGLVFEYLGKGGVWEFVWKYVREGVVREGVVR